MLAKINIYPTQEDLSVAVAGHLAFLASRTVSILKIGYPKVQVTI